MKKTSLTALAVAYSLTAGSTVMANAPVVDESQNYTVHAEAQPQSDNGWTEPKPIVKASPSLEEGEAQSLAMSEPATESTTEELLTTRIDAMQREIQQLRGLLEVQAHDLKLIRQQQQAFYKDLDQRLATAAQQTVQPDAMDLELSADAVDNSTLKNKASSVNTVEKSSNPADEEIGYAAAYELIRNKEFDQALPAMKSFIRSYPGSQYAPNAHYWLGELLLAEKQTAAAIIEFQTVLSQYPKSSKVAASMLKLGFAYIELGETNKAQTQLKQVMSQFPDTSSARLAKTRLSRIRRGNV